MLSKYCGMVKNFVFIFYAVNEHMSNIKLEIVNSVGVLFSIGENFQMFFFF